MTLVWKIETGLELHEFLVYTRNFRSVRAIQ